MENLKQQNQLNLNSKLSITSQVQQYLSEIH